MKATNLRSGRPWVEERLIFYTVHGSHAYGTNIVTSDRDFRGITIPPPEIFHGFTGKFAQAESKKFRQNKNEEKPEKLGNAPADDILTLDSDDDIVIFDIRKFFALASVCNPNALEIIFTDPSDHVKVTPAGQVLLENRELFLSKKVRNTFGGYARSQLARILRHHRYLKDPPKAPPTRADFNLPERTVIPADQLAAAFSAVQKVMDRWEWKDMDDFDPDLRIFIQNNFQDRLLELTQWAWADQKEKIWENAARTIGLDTNFIELLDMERRYNAKQKEWESYQRWLKNRNPQRAELEAKYGYDCYASDTEFLTEAGWKKFDDVAPQDKLATVFLREGLTQRAYLSVEYEQYTDKFDAKYNGPMYHFTGHHTDTLVTSNHRMLIQKKERRSEARFGWNLIEASQVPDTFEVLVAPTPRQKSYSNQALFGFLPEGIRPKDLLTLMGWYLSDGCSNFQPNGSPKHIRISQDVDGKLAFGMRRWQKAFGESALAHIYEYEREPNAYNPNPHMELVLTVGYVPIVQHIVDHCSRTVTKRIPRYAFGLSKQLMDSLLMAMIRGDGTDRNHKTKSDSFTYYSKSLDLANDIQELGVMAGWETALWGPYKHVDVLGNEIEMYQVHLRPNTQTRVFVRSNNVERLEVVDQRVVCFSVPNGTLITRRNGKVAIHGNCKHGMHLVRLFTTCKELGSTGTFTVRRSDAEIKHLLGIRNGALPLPQLLEWVEEQEKELDPIFKTSPLAKDPDINKLNSLCIQLVEASFRD